MTQSGPVYLNLLKIRLPITGMVSLAHRVSGVLIFLSLPLLVWMLEQSVSNEAGFQQVMHLMQSLPARLLSIVLLWSLAHHFFAGIRFLLLDVDIAVEKQQSRVTAWLVVAAEVLTMLLIVGALI